MTDYCTHEYSFIPDWHYLNVNAEHIRWDWSNNEYQIIWDGIFSWEWSPTNAY